MERCPVDGVSRKLSDNYLNLVTMKNCARKRQYLDFGCSSRRWQNKGGEGDRENLNNDDIQHCLVLSGGPGFKWGSVPSLPVALGLDTGASCHETIQWSRQR